MFHLTRTLAALCLCPENASDIEAKNNGLFVWQRKSKRQRDGQAVVWLLQSAFTGVYRV